SAQIREILISESAWEEMTCLFAPSLTFWQFAIQLILLIKSTDNKDGHLLRIDVNGLHLTCLPLWNGE
ncbi:hypothetical protein RAF80_27135, partial [Klebsiella pneumoniae]